MALRNASDFNPVSTTHSGNEEILNVIVEGAGSSSPSDEVGKEDNSGINSTFAASKIQT
jgi:hypothetical protein